MSAFQIGIASLMMFLGCTALSATGFGIGMVAMPGLLFVLEPQTAVVVLNTVAIAVEGWIVVQARKEIPIPGGSAGRSCRSARRVPLRGVYTEASRSRASCVSAYLGLIIAFWLPRLRLTSRETFPYSRAVGILAGFVVGVVLPAFGVGGPLVTLYLLTRNWGRQSVRAAMAFYLLRTGRIQHIRVRCRGSLHGGEAELLIAAYGDSNAPWPGFGTRLGDSPKVMSERVFRFAVVTIECILSSLSGAG